MSRSALFLSMFLFGGASYAASLDFSELPVSIPNGFLVEGVCLTWSNPASASQFQYGATMDTAAFGVTLLSDPVLQGPGDGNLAIDFSSPVDDFSFALAVCCGPITDGLGATVSIGALNRPVGVALTEPLELVSEGWFSYGGPPITSVTLAFPEASMFALDNLSFHISDAGAAPVPEPDPALLIAGGLFVVALVCANRRRLSSESDGSGHHRPAAG